MVKIFNALKTAEYIVETYVSTPVEKQIDVVSE